MGYTLSTKSGNMATMIDLGNSFCFVKIGLARASLADRKDDVEKVIKYGNLLQCLKESPKIVYLISDYDILRKKEVMAIVPVTNDIVYISISQCYIVSNETGKTIQKLN